MLDIYICEDNLKQLAFIKEKVENIIAFEELDIKIKTATNSPNEILIKASQSHNCGLYFLDIDLKNEKINGFTLAQAIRKIEPRCFIVFITSHIELSYLTYQYKVEALDFIIKENPETVKSKIHECILNAYEKHTGGSELYKNIYQVTMPGGKSIAVSYNDILCFETSDFTHKICLRSKQRIIEFSDQLGNIESKLNHDFFRCHRSVIVNIHHIKEINYHDCLITLCDGSTCPLSVRKKGALKNTIKNFQSKK